MIGIDHLAIELSYLIYFLCGVHRFLTKKKPLENESFILL